MDNLLGSAGHPVDLAAVLARRDARVQRQHDVITERHMPLVSLSIVSPGPVKNSELIQRIFEEAAATVEVEVREYEQWPIWVREEFDGPTGPELLLAVDAFEGDLKRVMVDLENDHPRGRLWDVDVIGSNGRPISRADIGVGPRLCLICDQPAAECARSRRHSVEELSARIRELAEM